MSTLGERIVIAREAKGMSKKAFADALGMSLSGLYLYEHDKRKPMEAVIQSMAREAGVSFRWLNGGQGDMYEELWDQKDAGDERILRKLSRREKDVLLKFLDLETSDRRNIRIYLEQRIDMILERYRLRAEEEQEEEG